MGALVWYMSEGEAPPKRAGDLAVPSGQALSVLDTVQAVPGPEGLTVRFRFLAPEIARSGGTIDAETAQTDMAWLCENYALPRVPEQGPEVQQVIISLADRAVEFGAADPEATQFFEAYDVTEGTCIWEAF